MRDDPSYLFCFGLGYTATRLARVLLAEGWSVAGTRRDGGGEVDLVVHANDGTRPLDPALLVGVTHLLSSVPPDEAGDPVLRHGPELAGELPGLAWCGYLSTTGVYGDRGGGWVDELAVPLDVFRIAGIYGPGRNQLAALHAALVHPAPGRIYNLADDAPAPPGEVIVHAAELLGVDPPPPIPFETAEISPMARSFYAESKRVSNRRIKEELGLQLSYPTYREGLAALLRDGD